MRKMSTAVLVKTPSNNSGGPKMSFGMKATKKKKSHKNIQEISDDNYDELCMEVAKRILSNKREETKLYTKTFSNTTKNSQNLNQHFHFNPFATKLCKQ